MYAIVENGSKQYKAEVGSVIKFEKLSANVGDKVEFGVLLVADEAGVKVAKDAEAKGQEDHRLQVQGEEEREKKAGPQAALHRGQDYGDRREIS